MKAALFVIVLMIGAHTYAEGNSGASSVSSVTRYKVQKNSVGVAECLTSLLGAKAKEINFVDIAVEDIQGQKNLLLSFPQLTQPFFEEGRDEHTSFVVGTRTVKILDVQQTEASYTAQYERSNFLKSIYYQYVFFQGNGLNPARLTMVAAERLWLFEGAPTVLSCVLEPAN